MARAERAYLGGLHVPCRDRAVDLRYDSEHILLRDSAHIMLQDAEHLNRQRMRVKLLSTRRTGRNRRRPRHAQAGAPSGDRFDPLPAPVNTRDRAAPALDLPEREVLPLYLEEDVGLTMPLFAPHEYGEWFEAAPGMRFRFHEAGHILGSTWIEAELGDGRAKQRLVFTGDYGRKPPLPGSSYPAAVRTVAPDPGPGRPPKHPKTPRRDWREQTT